MSETIIEKDEQEFLDWLQAKGLSDQTLAVYRNGLRHFARWYWLIRGKQLSAEEIEMKDIEEYRAYIWGRKRQQGPRLAGGTISTYVSATRHFLEWALQSSTSP
ncbi:MAG: phage integrase N-terminal SAM-like domain-containing protein [Chloroflexi bacterium]|nr:phage integrase N-terminal SAM-like domain-containing protein [Chloroflexota bacterium]MCH8876205.1 phage integrase N-terminal SAM-like domain-containing protein [Chloroflexota bacterium]MCI0771924.1 phage integrase N-terminal SAM-like domain-containing protein [Chloroflexota bacterium]MCI0807143.1 phage integrase N-terminal SAM-like domain-containing protein [Chloroflexota bacterium]MCI0828133.1 phage integrase N-terminal SAM-like domain-containing protein [Chloroflexota bacterium]